MRVSKDWTVSFAALVVAVLASCAGKPEPVPGGRLDSGSRELQARLVEEEWRLFSMVFSALPRGGYPIGFEADGRVLTQNLALVDRWRLDGQTLLLSTGPDIPRESLIHDTAAGVFVSPAGARPALVIGPEGFDFLHYLQNLEKE